MYEYYIFFKSTPELTNVWTVGQKIWVRDSHGTYESLNKEWSEQLKPIMDALLGKTIYKFENQYLHRGLSWIVFFCLCQIIKCSMQNGEIISPVSLLG
jgi:hypothetical protein